jgi:hypothetical protein
MPKKIEKERRRRNKIAATLILRHVMGLGRKIKDFRVNILRLTRFLSLKIIE